MPWQCDLWANPASETLLGIYRLRNWTKSVPCYLWEREIQRIPYVQFVSRNCHPRVKYAFYPVTMGSVSLASVSLLKASAAIKPIQLTSVQMSGLPKNRACVLFVNTTAILFLKSRHHRWQLRRQKRIRWILLHPSRSKRMKITIAHNPLKLNRHPRPHRPLQNSSNSRRAWRRLGILTVNINLYLYCTYYSIRYLIIFSSFSFLPCSMYHKYWSCLYIYYYIIININATLYCSLNFIVTIWRLR